MINTLERKELDLYEPPAEIPILGLNRVTSNIESEREKHGQCNDGGEDDEAVNKIDPSTIAFNQFVD